MLTTRRERSLRNERPPPWVCGVTDGWMLNVLGEVYGVDPRAAWGRPVCRSLPSIETEPLRASLTMSDLRAGDLQQSAPPAISIPDPAAVARVVESARAYANLRADRQDFAVLGEDGWFAVLADSHLAEELNLRGKGGLMRMAWTRVVADLAVDWIFEHVDEPLLLAASVGRVVETAHHTFIDPISAGRVQNLSAAKRNGTFFTPVSVGHYMAAGLLDQVGLMSEDGIRVLEPAAGTGVLAASLLATAAAREMRIAHIDMVEVSPYLAAIAERTIQLVSDRLGIQVSVSTHVGNALQFMAETTSRYEAVIMNPPYGRVKFLKSFVTDAQTRATNASDSAQLEADRVANLKRRLHHVMSKTGLTAATSDLQTLFMMSALGTLTGDGYLSVISPSTWTSSVSYRDVRRTLVGEGRVRAITHFSEAAGLFATVNQPTAVTLIGPPGGSIITVADSQDKPAVEVRIAALDPDSLQLPRLLPGEEFAHARLRTARTAASFGISSRRGEVDLTLDKGLISASSTPHRLVRGDHIERYELRDVAASRKDGFVSEEGSRHLARRPKGAHAGGVRLAGRQVSYMGKRRRLSFAEVPAGVFLANSCNYLLLPPAYDRDLALAVLNCSALDWWFKVHSSNNHVSNVETDALPWPDLAPRAASIVAAASRSISEASSSGGSVAHLEDIIDALILQGFGLAGQAAEAVLRRELDSARVERVLSLVNWFNQEGIPDSLLGVAGLTQHSMPTLSALDREMISHVPQGGNWQNIPESVPSERLKQIRSMSAERGVVRTTYYGRLRPDQPAYTIATYYNRPGNGTNIHPTQDRTLSHREAARLQSFPDDFLFIGGEGAIRKQIGNAVPPRLGEAVASAVRGAGIDGLAVDLFAGCGGLSLGLEQAGFDVAVAVDNDAACGRTYRFNRPSETTADPSSSRTLFSQSDLSSVEGRAAALLAIDQKLAGRPVGVLVGGPPCQGFSHAGFRSETDGRNDLAVAFMDFVRELRPAAVIMENVEGILTYKNGAVVRDLVTALRELGYEIDHPWVLAAEQFGVPQMRRRVFLVASRTGVIQSPEPRYARCHGRREALRESGTLPYPITAGETLAGLPELA